MVSRSALRIFDYAYGYLAWTEIVLPASLTLLVSQSHEDRV